MIFFRYVKNRPNSNFCVLLRFIYIFNYSVSYNFTIMIFFFFVILFVNSRKDSIVVRTQLSIRVHLIIGKYWKIVSSKTWTLNFRINFEIFPLLRKKLEKLEKKINVIVVWHDIKVFVEKIILILLYYVKYLLSLL